MHYPSLQNVHIQVCYKRRKIGVSVTLKKRESSGINALFSTGHQILTSDKFTMVMFIRGTTVILQVQNRTINGITYWNIYGNFIICS